MPGILDAIFGAPTDEAQRFFGSSIPLRDQASGLPNIGWLNPGFRVSPNSIAGAEYDANAAGSADDAREVAAKALAQRMRRQTPTVPPPAGGDAAWPSGGASPAVNVLNPSMLGTAPPPAGGASADQPIDEASAAARADVVPMPRPRPPMVPASPSITPGLEQPDALPPNASPTSGPIPAATAAPGAPSQPGLLDRVGAGLTNNAPLLMALGAGFAGAPSLGSGISRALQFAGPVAGQNQTVNALVAKGMPIEMARAAAANPAIMQQIVPSLFGPKQLKFSQVGEDMLGNKQYGFIDEARGLAYDLHGRPMNAPVGPAAGLPPTSGAAPAGAPAKGNVGLDNWADVNHNLVGGEYLAQFSPELQQAAKDYVSGLSMPTGNPRKGFTQAVKMIAQKYGNDIGMPADDTSFNARREMRNQLSRAAPGSSGGQITFGGTSLGHLAEVAEKSANLGNVSGFGVAPFAHWANWARSLGTDQAAKVNEVNGSVQHYGQEITKFYTGSPGGEAERMRFLSTMDSAKSPAEIAAAIRAERDLIPSRLDQLKGQIETTLGPQEAEKYMARANLDKVIPRINTALAKLDPTGPEAKMLGGGAPARAAPAAAAAAPKPGRYMFDPATGQMVPQQ